MSQSYLQELLERAFLLQQKRVWSLETLLKLERGQILGKADASHRQTLIANLEGNLRVTRECLNDVARESGYESSAAKILDPTFNIGIEAVTPSESLESLLEQVDRSEVAAGVHNYRAMCRELAVQHEPYFQDVEGRIRDDVAFYRAARDLDLMGQKSTDKPGDEG